MTVEKRTTELEVRADGARAALEAFARSAEAAATASQKMATAQGVQQQATDRSLRKVDALDKQLERYARTLDPLGPQLAKIERSFTAFNAGLDRGKLSADTYLQRVDQLARDMNLSGDAVARLARIYNEQNAAIHAGTATHAQRDAALRKALATEIDAAAAAEKLAAAEAAAARQMADFQRQATEARAAAEGQDKWNSYAGALDRVSKSARDSASVFQELFAAQDRQAEAAKEAAQTEAAAVAQRVAAWDAAQRESEANAAMIIADQRAQTEAAEKAAQAQERLDQQLNSLVGSYAPLAAEARKLREAETLLTAAIAAGGDKVAIYQQALARVHARQTKVNVLQERSAAGFKLTGYAVQNLSFQVNDLVTQIAAGTSPMQAFAQQGGQIVQIFQMSGVSLGRVVLGVTAVAAALVTAGAAYLTHATSVRQVEAANLAAGNAIGQTRSEMEAMAVAAADTGGVSVAAAREMQTALLRADGIGAPVMRRLIAMSRDYAAATGKDVTSALDNLAAAFADPSKGAADLTRSMRLLTDAELAHIQRLGEQGDKGRAQVALADALNGRIKNQADQLSLTAGLWDRIWRAVSNTFDKIGQAMAPETTQQAIVRLKDAARVAAVRAGADISVPVDPAEARWRAQAMSSEADARRILRPSRDDNTPQSPEAIARELQVAYDQLEAETKAAALAAIKVANNAAVAAAAEVARGLDPYYATLRSIDAQLGKLERGEGLPGMEAGLDVSAAKERLNNQRADLLTAQRSGLSVDTYKAEQQALLQLRAARIADDAARERYVTQGRAEIEMFGTATTAVERAAAARIALLGVTAGLTTAAVQAADASQRDLDASAAIADAYAKSTAEGLRAEAMSKALADARRVGADRVWAEAEANKALAKTVADFLKEQAKAQAGYAAEEDGLRAVAAAAREGAAAEQAAADAAQVDAKYRDIRAKARKEELPAIDAEIKKEKDHLAVMRLLNQELAAKRQLRANEDARSLNAKELALIQQGVYPIERERILAHEQARLQIARDYANVDQKTRDDLLAQADALADQNAQLELAKKNAEGMQNAFIHAAEGIQDAFTDTFKDIFSGGVTSFKDLAGKAKDIFTTLAAEITTLMVFRPVVGGVMGAVGLGGMAQQMGMGGGFGGFGGVGGLGSIGNMGSLFSGGGISTGINSFGTSLGFADVSADFVGPLQAGQTAGMTFTQFLGPAAVVAAGGGFVGGGIASAMGGNSKTGSILGSLIGGLPGGLIGGLQKPSNHAAISTFDVESGRTSYTYAKGDENIAARDQLQQAIIAVAQSLKGAAGASGYAHSGVYLDVGSRDGTQFSYAGGSYKADDPQAALAQITRLLAGDLAGLDAKLKAAIGKVDFSDAGKAVGDIGFARRIVEFNKSIGSLGFGLAQVAEQARKAAEETQKQILADRDLAESLGLGNEYLANAEAQLRAQLSGQQYTDVQAALTGVNTQFDVLAETVTKLGLDISEAEIAAGRNTAIETLLKTFSDDQLADAASVLGGELGALAESMIGAVRGVDALRQAGAGIADWLDQLRSGSNSGLTAEGRLQEAQAQFARDIDLARANNAAALGRITGVAGNLLDATTAMYGHTAQYQAMRQWIEEALSGLPATEAARAAIPAYASGTSFHPGGLAMVGEQGPELVRLPRGAQVYPHGETARMMAGGDAALREEVRQLRGQVQQLTEELRGLVRVSAVAGNENTEGLTKLETSLSRIERGQRRAGERR